MSGEDLQPFAPFRIHVHRAAEVVSPPSELISLSHHVFVSLTAPACPGVLMDIVQPVHSIATTYVQPGPYRTLSPIIVEVRSQVIWQRVNHFSELRLLRAGYLCQHSGNPCERITAATTCPLASGA